MNPVQARRDEIKVSILIAVVLTVVLSVAMSRKLRADSLRSAPEPEAAVITLTQP